jgi:hypothetical protein
MPNSDVFAFQRSGFDRFLCASVGTEPNGADLNLMSVFARLGDDPWREAGRLFEMPKAEAINSLARPLLPCRRASGTFRTRRQSQAVWLCCCRPS